MKNPELLVATFLTACSLTGQQVPPSITAEGVPEVPAQMVRRLSPYQNIRGASFQSWHPARREMLINTRFGDVSQIHVVKTPGGARRQMTFLREPIPAARFDSAGRDFFVFAMAEGGAEFYQLYRLDLGTGERHLLTDGKSRHSFGPSSAKGDRIAYTSTARNGRDNDIYIMNPQDPASAKLVYQVQGSWRPMSWSRDDLKLLVGRYISINESELHVLDLTTGTTEIVCGAPGEQVACMGGSFSRDGKGIYLLTDRDSEFLRLGYLDLSTRKLTILTPQIEWDIEGFGLSDDGSMLWFVVNEGGMSKLHLMQTASRKEVPLPALPAGQVLGGAFHKSLPELSFSMISAKVPGDVYSFNWKTGELARWTESEAGGLVTSLFPDTQLIHYPTFDKVGGKPRMIPAFIVKPPARFKPPYPVLVSIHGGPESQARPGLNAAYIVNEMGIARIVPNVRGSAGYGKTYLKLDNAERREDSVKDIGALLDWIEAQPDLDAKRVAVVGGSYGGYMTLASLVHYSDRLKCGIDIVGISNWVTFLKNTQGYRQDLRRAEYGDERDPKMRDFFETISPLNNSHKIKSPLLIVQGRNDPRVPVTESLQMVKKLKDQGNTVWYIEASDEGHGFAKRPNRNYQEWAEILFLEQFLLK